MRGPPRTPPGASPWTLLPARMLMETISIRADLLWVLQVARRSQDHKKYVPVLTGCEKDGH